MEEKQKLYEMYNATSTDDGKGNIETYENWLERQLISRIKTIEQIQGGSITIGAAMIECVNYVNDDRCTAPTCINCGMPKFSHK